MGRGVADGMGRGVAGGSHGRGQAVDKESKLKGKPSVKKCDKAMDKVASGM